MSGELPGFAAFAATVDEDYRIALEGGASIALTLVAARPVAGGAPGPDPTAFALEFRGPRTPAFGQGLVPLDHPRLGRLELFVVPIGEGPDGRRYEAVFG